MVNYKNDIKTSKLIYHKNWGDTITEYYQFVAIIENIFVKSFSYRKSSLFVIYSWRYINLCGVLITLSS